MNAKELAAKLRTVADEFETANTVKMPPLDTPNLKEAAERLRAVFPGKPVAIEMDVNFYSSGQSGITWRVYDGSTHHEGGTLAVAINKAVEGSKPDPAGGIDDAQEVLTATALAINPDAEIKWNDAEGRTEIVSAVPAGARQWGASEALNI